MSTVKEDSAPDEEHEEEWIRQTSLTYGGLIGIGTIMVQPFLTADSLNLSARVCVVAFSVAIPLLAGLLMVNWQESFRRRMSPSRIVAGARGIAQTSAVVGIVAGFWHILWLAGVGVLVGAVLAVVVQSAGYVRLEGLGDGEP